MRQPDGLAWQFARAWGRILVRMRREKYARHRRDIHEARTRIASDYALGVFMATFVGPMLDDLLASIGPKRPHLRVVKDEDA